MAEGAARRIEDLRARIREADRAYYLLDNPVLSDAEYDSDNQSCSRSGQRAMPWRR